MQKTALPLLVIIACYSLTGCATAAASAGVSPSQPPTIGGTMPLAEPSATSTRLPHIAVPPALAAIGIPLTTEPLNLDPLVVAAKKQFPSKQIRVILPDHMYTQDFSPDRINLQLTPNATHTQLVVSRIYPG